MLRQLYFTYGFYILLINKNEKVKFNKYQKDKGSNVR